MFFPYPVIREAVPIMVAAAHFGLELKPHPTQKGIFRTHCPQCEEKGGHSLTVTPHLGLFTCWKARKKGNPLRGDVIALAAHLKAVDANSAAMYLVQAFKIPNPTKEAAEPEGADMKAYRTTPMEPLPPHKDSMATTEKGFPLAICKAVGIKFAKYLPSGHIKVEWKKPVSIPIRDEKGKYLGDIVVNSAMLPPSWEGA